MTDDAQARAAVDELLRILDLDSTGARTTEDISTGRSHPMPHGRVYGGQVLAQSIVAAERTLPEGRVTHSMHGYFLRPGDTGLGVTFAVDRIHDGRSFSTRRAQAYQNGEPIFSMIASSQSPDEGLEHAEPMPEGIPGPDEVPSDDETMRTAHPFSRRILTASPVELRHVEGPLIAARVDGAHPSQAVWMRMRAPMPDDPALHRAALAYLSDMTIQESILRAHGATWETPGLKLASLDHGMWWHRPARVDEWLLYSQASPTARGGRGLATGRLYTQDGTLVASVSQEVMIRIPGAGVTAQS